MAETYQLKYADSKDMVWDYVEVREQILHFVTEHVAKDLYAELEKQFWFDPVATTVKSTLIVGVHSFVNNPLDEHAMVPWAKKIAADSKI